MKIEKISSDERRDIYLVDLLKEGEFTFIKLKENKAIGGCIHEKYDEWFVVISGFVTFYMNGKYRLCAKGKCGFIPKKKSHMFKAHKDSIICEWGVPASDKNKYDKEIREMVNKINNE